MKAFTKYKYGGPEVLQLEEIEKPNFSTDELLVKVKANSVNPADWHILRGKPKFARLMFGLFKPKNPVLGADFAGVVEEVGEHVTQFKKGDKVFGESLKGGAFAEFLKIKPNDCAKMPDGATFPQIAAVPIAGLTALQALLTHGNIQKGESVLINGASGGVGHFAVQIAKAAGAEVTAVCSAKNKSFVTGLGADHVIPYDEQDIHQHKGNYDLVVDNHGNLFHSDFKRMGKRGVVVGFTSVGHMFGVMIKKLFSKYPLTTFTAHANTEDLKYISSLIEQGKIKVHLEKVFPYTEIPIAVGYIEDMRTKGKVAMTWE